MDKERSLEILNIGISSTKEEVDRARLHKRFEVEKLILNAPNPILKKKYKDDLNELELAYQVALGPETKHPPGMNVTRMRDRAGARVLYRESGDNSEERSLGISAGDVLLNNYEVRHLLGAGGTGAVFSAFDKEMEQEIAIKVFLPSLFQTPKRREEFTGLMTKVTKELVSSGIVRPYDVKLDGDFLIVAMELVRGVSLDKEIKDLRAKGVKLEAEKVLNWAEEISSILTLAHKTLAHKNLKPANIFLTRDGSLKITDFGIGEFLASEALSKIAHIMGTDHYIAPEQLQIESISGPKSDQYSLAILLYELLSGAPLPRRLPPLKEIRDDIPDQVSDVLDRALESDPTLRFKDLEEFKTALSTAKSRRTFRNTIKIPINASFEPPRKRFVNAFSRPSVLALVLTSVIILVYLAFIN